MPTAEQKRLLAGGSAALLAAALLFPSEAKRKAVGRAKIIAELAKLQLQSLLAGRADEDTTFGDYVEANVDLFRFLAKVMYAYKCDLLDTRGDYLQTAPPHLQVGHHAATFEKLAGLIFAPRAHAFFAPVLAAHEGRDG
jgi:hypothetical protein